MVGAGKVDTTADGNNIETVGGKKGAVSAAAENEPNSKAENGEKSIQKRCKK
jgi:hypothetical protein